MINTAKAIKFLNDQELFKTSYPEDDLQEHIARQMQKYADQQLILSGVSGSFSQNDMENFAAKCMILGSNSKDIKELLKGFCDNEH